MSNEVGSTLLNSFNKTGFDAGNMAKVVAEAEVAGPRAIVAKNEERISKELNAWTYVKANLDAFNTYAKDLATPALFNQYQATSSNEQALTAEVTGTPVAATYTIESVRLAQNHATVVDTLYASKQAAISEGDLSITVAGQTKTLTIDSSNNTLEGLANSINQGDFGISASIVKNGSEFQLLFSSKTSGGDGVFSLTGVAEFDDTNTSITSQGQDAQMRLNGLLLSSSTNEFEGVIEGVNLTLNSQGTTQTLNVNRNTEGVKKAVEDFVMVYNQLDTIFKDLGSYETLTEEQKEDPANEFKGELAGNTLLRELKTQIRDSLSNLSATAAPGQSNNFLALTSLGISFDRTGVMSLDNEVLDTALQSNMDEISKLLSKSAYSDDSLIRVVGGSDKTLTGSYQLEITEMAQRASITSDAFDTNADGLISIGADASFKIKVDQSTEATISLAEGDYTPDNFASMLRTAINNDTTIKTAGAQVLVGLNGDGTLSLSSERYGAFSRLEVWDMANMGEFNFTIPAGDDPFTNQPYTSAIGRGKNTDGFLTMADGSQLNIGAYADIQDGRKIKISDFAFVDNQAAPVRGLEFEILGGTTGSRGTIEYSQGAISRLYENINSMITDKNGLLNQRTESLTNRMTEVEEKKEKLDLRFEKLELKYRMQFSMLQSVMSQMQSTQDFLSATYNKKD